MQRVLFHPTELLNLTKLLRRFKRSQWNLLIIGYAEALYDSKLFADPEMVDDPASRQDFIDRIGLAARSVIG